MAMMAELRRRNVFRIAAAYVVSAWLVIQVAETILPFYGAPDSAIRYLITALAVGFLPATVLAWVFELTPEGVRREKDTDHDSPVSRQAAKRLDRIVIVLLALALGYFAFDKFVLADYREKAIAEAAREQGRSEAVIESFGERSIAVLPFADLSPGRDQEYMSDGIAEEILNLLASVPDLRVISRSSAFSFKDQDLQLPEIASRLNAAYILEGSVRTAGEEIRITAQLIDASSDTHKWSKTYDRKLENIFDIQDDIAAQVVGELRATLLDGAPTSQRLDEEAYKLVLQARYLWNRRAEGDEQRALELYRDAVDIDPDYAPAWTGLSVAYAVAALKGRIEREDGLARARAAVDKALELDPDSAEALVRRGQANARAGNFDAMFEDYRRAYELDPDNPLTLGVMATLAGREGRIEDVVRLYDAAAELDPLGAIWPGNKASWLIRFRRADDAEKALLQNYELNGNTDNLNDGMADISNIRGDYAAALEHLASLPPHPFNETRRAVALYGVGRTRESNAILEEFEAMEGGMPALGVAMIYAARGDNDLAFEWLNKVEGVAPHNIVYDAYTRVLTDDARWKPYVDSLDWQWEYRY